MAEQFMLDFTESIVVPIIFFINENKLLIALIIGILIFFAFKGNYNF
jgi:hypothetical protein